MTKDGKIISAIFICIILAAALASGCCQPAQSIEQPTEAEPTEARMVFSSFAVKIIAICDQGNLIYTTNSGRAMHVIEGGCR